MTNKPSGRLFLLAAAILAAGEPSPATRPAGALPAAADRPEAPIAPAELRCEYRSDPLGIDAPRPRLSWALRLKSAP